MDTTFPLPREYLPIRTNPYSGIPRLWWGSDCPSFYSKYNPLLLYEKIIGVKHRTVTGAKLRLPIEWGLWDRQTKSVVRTEFATTYNHRVTCEIIPTALLLAKTRNPSERLWETFRKAVLFSKQEKMEVVHRTLLNKLQACTVPDTNHYECRMAEALLPSLSLLPSAILHLRYVDLWEEPSLQKLLAFSKVAIALMLLDKKLGLPLEELTPFFLAARLPCTYKIQASFNRPAPFIKPECVTMHDVFAQISRMPINVYRNSLGGVIHTTGMIDSCDAPYREMMTAPNTLFEYQTGRRPSLPSKMLAVYVLPDDTVKGLRLDFRRRIFWEPRHFEPLLKRIIANFNLPVYQEAYMQVPLASNDPDIYHLVKGQVDPFYSDKTYHIYWNCRRALIGEPMVKKSTFYAFLLPIKLYSLLLDYASEERKKDIARFLLYPCPETAERVNVTPPENGKWGWQHIDSIEDILYTQD